MLIEKRLDAYFTEAKKHIALIEEANSAISLPIQDYDTLPSLEKFAINALVFRFSKLQDLIGSKIFRAFLEFNRFDVQDKSFLLLLKEIEKEGIVDIDTWDELRKVRNNIAHEYPGEEDELMDALELLIRKTPLLLEISSKLQERYNEIREV
ncbi:hypothetical protein [Sulfurimonas sp.]|uniref:hypothetical protein n=1 Tax=Sulfurimonas sp. TaxID=2022749 RepID=UPI002616F443|nr:hypothetical protein [Sulfurimonas sp.]